MLIKVYTDGACTQNGKIGSQASWAYYFPDTEFKKYSSAGRVPSDEKQTNNRGELTAIAEAIDCIMLNFTAAEVDLVIYTDSTYSKNCLTVWLPGWVRSGWITAGKREPVINRDLIEEISDALTKFKSYTIHHVLAHTNGKDEHSVNNAIADKMATEVLTPPPPPTAAPTIVSNTTEAIAGLPLRLMGPSATEKELVDWCRLNLDKLDKTAVKNALISALSKTVSKNGFKLEKVPLHRSVEYRLVPTVGLITEEKDKDNGNTGE